MPNLVAAPETAPYLAEQDKRNAVDLAITKVTSELEKAAAAKDAETKQER